MKNLQPENHAFLLSMLAIASLTSPLLAATAVWDGSTDTNWAGPTDATSFDITYNDGDDVTFGDTGAGTVTITSDVSPTSIVVNNSSGNDYTFTGSAITSGSIRKEGAGTLILDSANSYSGGTRVGTISSSTEGGTIVVMNNSSLGTGQALFEQGGNISLGADNLTIANSIGWYNWGGTTARQITLDLAGSNTGTLSGGFEIRNSGQNVFDVGADDTLNLTGTLRNTHSSHIESGIRKRGTGTVVLSNNNTYRGATRVEAGTLTLGNGGTTGNLNSTSGNADIIISAGATFAINQSDAVVQGTDFNSDPISGDGNLTQMGTGTTTLTAANTYTGTTTVLSGTLALTGSGAIDSSNEITIANGAIFDVSGTTSGGYSFNNTVSGTGTVTGDLTTSSTAIINPGDSFGADVGTLQFSSSLTTEGSEINITLSANNLSDKLELTGAITMNAGTKINLILGYTPLINDSFDIIDASSITGSDITGIDFLTRADGGTTVGSLVLPTLAAGQQWDLSQFVSNGVITVVPEPSSIFLMLSSSVFLLQRRRR